MYRLRCLAQAPLQRFVLPIPNQEEAISLARRSLGEGGQFPPDGFGGLETAVP